MARMEKPRREHAGASLSTLNRDPFSLTGWRAQLIAIRFGMTLEAAAIVAALALGGAHG